jgi:hypothetical protein
MWTETRGPKTPPSCGNITQGKASHTSPCRRICLHQSLSHDCVECGIGSCSQNLSLAQDFCENSHVMGKYVAFRLPPQPICASFPCVHSYPGCRQPCNIQKGSNISTEKVLLQKERHGLSPFTEPLLHVEINTSWHLKALKEDKLLQNLCFKCTHNSVDIFASLQCRFISCHKDKFWLGGSCVVPGHQIQSAVANVFL